MFLPKQTFIDYNIKFKSKSFIVKLIFLTDSSFNASVLFPPRFSGGICTVSTLQRYKLGRNSITKAMIKIFILKVY